MAILDLSARTTGYHQRRINRQRIADPVIRRRLRQGTGGNDGYDVGGPVEWTEVETIDEEPDATDEQGGSRVLQVRGGDDTADRILQSTRLPDDTAEWVPLTNAGTPSSMTFYVASTQNLDNEWVNMPNILTELFGASKHIRRVALGHATEFRLVVTVLQPGSVNAYLCVLYSVPPATLDSFLGGQEPVTFRPYGRVSIAAAGTFAGSWTGIAEAAAKQDVDITIYGEVGDGVADPRIGGIDVQFR